MMDYLRHMKVYIIILVVLGILAGVLHFTLSGAQDTVYTRGNNACEGKRVFDNADLLTDEEEQILQERIDEAQDRIGCDIAVVTLNESIKDYAIADQGYEIDESKYVMVYADNFYDQNAFGYDLAHGDGCVLVDNWYRGDSQYGYAYNWISTSGRMINDIGYATIQSIIDDVNEVVNDDPLKAYLRYVDRVESYMEGVSLSDFKPSYGFIGFIAVIYTLILFLVNKQKNLGAKTVDQKSYVKSTRFVVNKNVLEHSHVSSRHIDTSSGSRGGGGGGSHISSGGFSHGGGGGHH